MSEETEIRTPQLDPELEQLEARIRELHERLLELKTSCRDGARDGAAAEAFTELEQRVESIWAYFVSIERIREAKLRRLAARLEELAANQPQREIPAVPPVDPAKIGPARSRRGFRLLRWPRLAGLLLLNVLTNIYIIIWEQRHDSKIFPGT
jgi:hypothetical protein